MTDIAMKDTSEIPGTYTTKTGKTVNVWAVDPPVYAERGVSYFDVVYMSGVEVETERRSLPEKTVRSLAAAQRWTA